MLPCTYCPVLYSLAATIFDVNYSVLLALSPVPVAAQFKA